MFRHCLFNQTHVLLKLLTGLFMACLLTACGGNGDRVRNADNNQVVFIGDSIYAQTGEIQDFLEGYAGETFRNYSQGGAQIFGDFLGAQPIPEQFDEAIADNPDIDLVVGNGGGNDIVVPAVLLDPHKCKTRWYQFGNLSNRCKEFIDGLYFAGLDLLESYTQFGVENAIYLGYYYTKFGLLGNLELLKEAVDYGDETVKRACENSPIPCTFVDPRPVINNRDIVFDGIHPKTSGSKKMADLIWPVMEPLL